MYNYIRAIWEMFFISDYGSIDNNANSIVKHFNKKITRRKSKKEEQDGIGLTGTYTWDVHLKSLYTCILYVGVLPAALYLVSKWYLLPVSHIMFSQMHTISILPLSFIMVCARHKT